MAKPWYMEKMNNKSYSVRSPKQGHTIKQLENLKAEGWHNADTGTEISEEEGNDYLNYLRQRQADKKMHSFEKSMASHKTRSQGRPWIPQGQVIFRTIHGHRVPFVKRDRPEDLFGPL